MQLARLAPHPLDVQHHALRALAKAKASLQADVDQELLVEKEQEIHDLRETVDILEQKIAKLEQLVRLKDAKIQKLKDAAAGRR